MDIFLIYNVIAKKKSSTSLMMMRVCSTIYFRDIAKLLIVIRVSQLIVTFFNYMENLNINSGQGKHFNCLQMKSLNVYNIYQYCGNVQCCHICMFSYIQPIGDNFHTIVFLYMGEFSQLFLLNTELYEISKVSMFFK